MSGGSEDFSSGGLIKRAKALIPILIPLLVSSFKRAEELAIAMECRCYRGDKNRTKLVKLTYRLVDLRWSIYTSVILASVILLRFVSVPEEIGNDVLTKILRVLLYRLQ